MRSLRCSRGTVSHTRTACGLLFPGTTKSISRRTPGFSLHRDVAPSIPILPPAPNHALLNGMARHCLETMTYAVAYDGIVVLNRSTLFAVKLCHPESVFLSPLLRRKMSLDHFLSLRIVQSNLMDVSRIHVDRMSHHWWKTMIPEMLYRIFGHECHETLSHISHQVQHISHWISFWMSYVSALAWDEWITLDIDLQRLYVLLDYVHDEEGGQWSRILRNAKYSNWVAKVVATTMDDGF